MKLKFTLSVQRDLVRLREFIAEKNPHAARRISQRLRASIHSLTDMPAMGVEVPELPGVQDLSGDYIVIVRYAMLEAEIFILRIWHGKENLR